MLCILFSLSLQAEPRDPMRCSNCGKKKKEAELQAAGITLATTIVNGAFSIAANPDDKNNKLQTGNAIALSFIGLVAAAMKTMPFDVYDSFGNKITPEKLANSIGARLETVDFGINAESLIRKHIAHLRFAKPVDQNDS